MRTASLPLSRSSDSHRALRIGGRFRAGEDAKKYAQKRLQEYMDTYFWQGYGSGLGRAGGGGGAVDRTETKMRPDIPHASSIPCSDNTMQTAAAHSLCDRLTLGRSHKALSGCPCMVRGPGVFAQRHDSARFSGSPHRCSCPLAHLSRQLVPVFLHLRGDTRSGGQGSIRVTLIAWSNG